MAKVRTISQDDLDQFGLDDQNRLYWNGKLVQTRQEVRLQWSVNVAIIVGSLSTAAIAAVEIVRWWPWG